MVEHTISRYAMAKMSQNNNCKYSNRFLSTLKMVEIFVQVLNPQNATCAEGEGGVCVSQLVAFIPDKHNVLDRKPDENIVLGFGFYNYLHGPNPFNRGIYDRFFGT